ncbi:MAG TPA: aldehyde dehydrogenase family protein [Gemmatimonadota bacterium]|nr:aldehyde dehydrogenase family protein [Gemmatimonadota bacterium]
MPDTATTAELPSALSPGRLFIDNEWVDADGGKTFEVVNPARAELLTEVAEGDRADVDRAVQAARRAFESDEWRRMAPRQRARILLEIARIMEERKDELARVETLQNGKPFFESGIDVDMTIETFEYYAGWTTKVEGETVPLSVPHQFGYTLREPVGVVGAIVPWNFPLNLASWKVAPALAVGCTVVLKPASETPLTALLLGEIAAEAGLPAGVLNVVPGAGRTAGEALVAHPDVDKIAFTGSTEVGRRIAKTAADTVKRVTLELGGKSPNIVFADADLPFAAKGAINGIFYGKGEVCAAGSRLLVEQSAHDALVSQVADGAGKLKIGDPFEKGVRIGAVVSEKQMQSVLGYIEKGMAEGAKVVAGGGRAEDAGPGYFVQPTVFDEVTPTMTIAREEIFGPVLATLSFGDVDEAIALANDSPYGLAAAVWTRDIKKAHYVAQRLQAGTVWINTYNLYDAAMPFGGYKASGYGRDLGRVALDGYTQTKSVWVDLRL